MITVSDDIELGGIAEIAAEFGVPRSTASMWARRRDRSKFPAPLVELAAGPVFDMAAVRHWYAHDRNPAKGSPEYWERRSAES